MQIILNPDEEKLVAYGIRSGTSDEVLAAIECKSDHELVEIAMRQKNVRRAINLALIIHFPRTVEQLVGND